MVRNAAFQYLSNGPFCVVAIDSSSGRAVQTNEVFVEHMGPMFKFAGFEFDAAATEGSSREEFEDAIASVTSGMAARVEVRNVEMITLAGESGVPIKRHFDWTVGKGGHDLILFGYPCSEQDAEQRSKDAELIDFFQNAPIALHWLSSKGIVLWANQTELDVLGYTAEEYIGQPIMKFCPDEEELVLEIFKQLGSGNAIRDVPVRFRTKDGRIVSLLIDSNVKYDTEGNFAHTRCFIRDDTKRKIRETQAKVLLTETKRSLKMLDNFMSRSIHHLRTPLHMMQSTCDLVSDILKQNNTMDKTVGESIKLLEQASLNIDDAVNMADDIVVLSRLDQGAELQVKNEVVNIQNLGNQVFTSVNELRPGVELTLEVVGGGGPAVIDSDASILKKILNRILENASDVTNEGSIKIHIGYENSLCTFAISNSGSDFVAVEPHTIDGKLPSIFQRYHQEVLPEDILDFEEAESLRSKIEKGVSSHKANSLGFGLSLSYFLVQALGGELRYSCEPGITKFWFSVPQHGTIDSIAPQLESAVNAKKGGDRGQKRVNCEDEHPAKRMKVKVEDMDAPPKVPKEAIAACGLTAMDTPSVLVVEDNGICAKLLCMTLRKFGCSTTVAENGQVAIDLLRSAPPGMYTLILMDLRMPVMDGLTACRIIKSELKLETPVIALTAETSSDIKEECATIGFNDFYSKPLKRAQLKVLLKTHAGYEA